MDIPDASSILELRESIENGRFNDIPLRSKGWIPSLNEKSTSYEEWRQCDQVYGVYRENLKTDMKDKAYLQVVLCTGRVFCPDITETWRHCVKEWKNQHVHQCIFVKRMMERCFRNETRDMLRKMDMNTFPK